MRDLNPLELDAFRHSDKGWVKNAPKRYEFTDVLRLVRDIDSLFQGALSRIRERTVQKMAAPPVLVRFHGGGHTSIAVG